MTEQEKAIMEIELEKASVLHDPMRWHNMLFSVADSLMTDDLYTKEKAAQDIMAVIKDMQDVIRGICGADWTARADS